MRDVEPVVAAERDEEVVARDARDLLRLEAEELADAVILVDDVVAVRRSANDASARPSRASARGGRLRNTCVSGSRTSPSSRQTNPRRAGETANRSAGVPRQRLAVRRASPLSTLRSSASWRSASPRCGNATTTRLPERTKPSSSVSASARPAGGDRGSLRLERERLPARERVELGGAVESRRASAPPRPRPRARRRAARRSPARGRSAGRGRPGLGGAPSPRPRPERARSDRCSHAPLGGRVDRGLARPGAARAA